MKKKHKDSACVADNVISEEEEAFLEQLRQIPTPELQSTERRVQDWCDKRGFGFHQSNDGLVVEIAAWHAYRINGNPVDYLDRHWIVDELYSDNSQTCWIELGRVRDLDIVLSLIEARVA